MPPKSKKGSKKKGKKGKKIVEEPKDVRDMIGFAKKGDYQSLEKVLGVAPADRKWDFCQTAGEALPTAAEFGHADATRTLLDAGCEVNILGGKALHKAAANSHLDIMQLLLEREADVNSKSIFTEYTALHNACLQGALPAVEFLLANNASVDSPTHDENCGNYNGWSALHFAADHGHLDIVQYLVEVGKATVDLKNPNGETALALAGEHGRFEVVKYLVAAGADLHATRRGLNVVQWCIYRANPDTVQFLVSFGAKPELKTKTLWFPDPLITLGELIKTQLSEAIFEKVDTAIYRGSVKLRERAAHMRIISEVKWTASSGGAVDPYAVQGGTVEGFRFPKHVVHMISSYEL